MGQLLKVGWTRQWRSGGWYTCQSISETISCEREKCATVWQAYLSRRRWLKNKCINLSSSSRAVPLHKASAESHQSLGGRREREFSRLFRRKLAPPKNLSSHTRIAIIISGGIIVSHYMHWAAAVGRKRERARVCVSFLIITRAQTEQKRQTKAL